MLFAFCGKRPLVERLLAGGLAGMPIPMKEFWLATADLAAGRQEEARRQLEMLRLEADPPTRIAVEHRLGQITSPPVSLDAAAERIIEAAALEQSQEENFGARPSLLSKAARATLMLIALNLFMFGVEMCLGGATNEETLLRLGGLFPPAVHAGQWWRLGTALFLHFGAVHLLMNMFALWLLGPFTEFALGFGRFLLVYALTGIGSMAVVLGFGSGPNGEQLTIGASGSIMGLVGVTGALMLRGWQRERASYAKRRLAWVFMIVGIQTVFDAVVPEVSMTGHLSGAIIGFAVGMILRDRLGSEKDGD
jgi:rhomboid protease GluP